MQFAKKPSSSQLQLHLTSTGYERYRLGDRVSLLWNGLVKVEDQRIASSGSATILLVGEDHARLMHVEETGLFLWHSS